MFNPAKSGEPRVGETFETSPILIEVYLLVRIWGAAVLNSGLAIPRRSHTNLNPGFGPASAAKRDLPPAQIPELSPEC